LVKLLLACDMKYIFLKVRYEVHFPCISLFFDSFWRMILNSIVFYFSVWCLGFSCQAWECVAIFLINNIVVVSVL
jgi:hypothetical protein